MSAEVHTRLASVSGCHLATAHHEPVGPAPDGFEVRVNGGPPIPGTLNQTVCDVCGEPCELVEIPEGWL